MNTLYCFFYFLVAVAVAVAVVVAKVPDSFLYANVVDVTPRETVLYSVLKALLVLFLLFFSSSLHSC